MSAIENLTKSLAALPGIGPKSAARIAYSLMKTPSEFNKILAENIATIQEKVKPCSVCGSFTETDPCPICSDPSREKDVLCIVEQPQDVLTIQNSGVYNGQFHVLGGAINPLNKVGPENLTFDKLLSRIKEGVFKEVIVATNPTGEGDITALYIRQILKDIPGLSITRLALGLPFGGDLEYADKVTLSRSLNGRIPF